MAHKPVNQACALVTSNANGSVGNGHSLSQMEMGFPSSSKSLSFAPRPGYGQVGTKCIVKANHFFAELPDKDLNQYDVSSIFFDVLSVVFFAFSFFLFHIMY